MTPSSYRKIEHPSLEAVQSILQQPFYYLGKGSQSFVFESEDKKWIVKFFRLNRFKTHQCAFLPKSLLRWQHERNAKKYRQEQELIESCLLAYTQLKEECALYYLHLFPTHDLNMQIAIYDKLGRLTIVQADSSPFLIQKKAAPLYTYLHHLIKENAHQTIRHILQEISSVLLTRFKKGIADHDPVIYKNMGIVADQPVFIDIGQFYHNRDIMLEKTYVPEGQNITKELQEWLSQHLPKQSRDIANSLKF